MSPTGATPAPPRPLRILWSWPHPHREPAAFGALLVEAGHDLTVECLSTFRGEDLPPEGAFPYRVRRDLPDVDHDAGSTAARLVDRVRTHVVRARRRHVLARTGGFDVVHVQTIQPIVDLLAIPLIQRHTPVVAVVHDPLPHRSVLPRALDRALHRRLYALPDRLIALDESVADDLVERFGVPGDRIDVIRYDVPQRALPKEEAPPPGQPATALFFGALRENKGLHTLLEAIEQVDAADLRFVIAGQGARSIEQDVREAARRHPNVTIELGYVSSDRRRELFEQADLVVLPYTAGFASMSAVLLDAYAHARPVVASSVGSIPAQVSADDCGWLVAPDDPAALARALTEAARAPDRRIAAGRRMAAALRDRDAASRADDYAASYRAAGERT